MLSTGSSLVIQRNVKSISIPGNVRKILDEAGGYDLNVLTLCGILGKWGKFSNNDNESFLEKTSVENITLGPYNACPESKLHDLPIKNITMPRTLDIDEQEAVKYVVQLKNLLRDPQKVAAALQNIDRQVGDKMGWESDSSSHQKIDILLRGDTGTYHPALPKGYIPLKKGRVLDEILSEHERQVGINMEGSAYFYGFVPGRDAKKFQLENLFKETPQVGRLLFHGKNSHRLHFEIMRQVDQDGSLPFPQKRNGEPTTAPELLQLFMARIPPKHNTPNVWSETIDNMDDQIDSGNKHRKEGMSAVSPFELNLMLLCFGSDIGLPHLQRALADSHFKQVAQMCDRCVRGLEQCSTENLTLLSNDIGIGIEELKNNPVPYLHDRLVLGMESFGPHIEEPGIANIIVPWVIDDPRSLDYHSEFKEDSPEEHRFKLAENRRHAARFTPFSEKYSKSIVKKTSSQIDKGSYESWKHYIQHVRERNSAQSESTPTNSPDVESSKASGAHGDFSDDGRESSVQQLDEDISLMPQNQSQEDVSIQSSAVKRPADNLTDTRSAKRRHSESQTERLPRGGLSRR